MKLPLSRLKMSGFTLIELVISGALMSIILVSGYACLRSGILSKKLIESRADVVQSARVAMALMSADLRSACPLSKKFEFVGMHRTVGDADADNLDFATHNFKPRRLHEGDFCEISYYLDKDRQSGKYSLWRRRDSTPDDEPFSGGNREELATGLGGLRFEYFDGYEWFDEWGDTEGTGKKESSLLDPGNLTGMPEAVRVTLWFDTNPKPSKEAKETDTPDKESAEPQLMFQTVVRLNLAAASQTSSSGSSSSSSQPQPGAAPAGGPQ